MSDKLPGAIARQVAAADQLFAALNGDAAAAAAVAATSDPFAAVRAATTSAPEGVSAAPAAATPPAQPPAPAPNPAPEASPAQTSAVLDPNQLRELIESQRLVREFINKSAAPPAAPAAPAPAPLQVDHQANNDEQIKKLFGDDVLSMVDKKIAEALGGVNAVLQRIEARFNQLGSSVQSTEARVAQTAEQACVAFLDSRNPNWRTTNVSPGFINWLRVTDPIFGIQRQAALDKASKALDGPAIAAIFGEYDKTQAPAPAAAPSPAPTAAPAPVAGQPNNGMASMVSPSTVGGGTPPPTPEAPIFTTPQIQSFYTDLRRGAYVGKEAEAKRIADAIDQAVAAGRVSLR